MSFNFLAKVICLGVEDVCLIAIKFLYYVAQRWRNDSKSVGRGALQSEAPCPWEIQGEKGKL